MAGCSSGGFSIRDYVLKMREVDAEKSWPFPGDEDKDVKRWQLPPMEKSKPAVWWANELERVMRSEAAVEAGETAALPKLCPVCSTFTTTTITAVNAHIDACLAATKEAPPTQRRRRRRRRTAKKRSIADLIAASPAVGPAGDKHRGRQEAPPPEEDITIITYKKRNCAYAKEMMKKMKGGIEPIKVQHSNKLRVSSGYLSGIRRSANLKRKQKYKVLATMILHKQRRARPHLPHVRKLLRAHRTWLLAKLLKIKPLVSRKLMPPSILKLSDDSCPEKFQEKEENRMVTIISDKIEVLGQTRPAIYSSELRQTQLTDEAATTMDSKVGSEPPLAGTVGLNQVILKTNDGKMQSKSPPEASNVQTFTDAEEGSAPIPPSSCMVQPMEVSSTKKCSRPSSTVYRPQPRRFLAGGVDVAPHFFQSGQSSNLSSIHSCSRTNLQPSTVYGRRQVNDGCIGLPLNSQGEVIYSFHPRGMAGLNNLNGKQYEAGLVDDSSIYRSFLAGHSNRMEHLNLIDKNIHGSQSYGGQTVGLINPEKTGNSHQELDLRTYRYHGRHAAHSRLTARDVEMQYVPKGNYQQTVRLMGKNLTVVNGNEENLTRGGRTATENYFPQGNYFDNSMSRHSLQEGSNRLQWPRVQSLAAGGASSSGARPFELRPNYVARGNYNSQKQGFGHQLEINHSQGHTFQNIPAWLVDSQRIPLLRSQCNQWQVVCQQLDPIQFTSENLPKWLVDAAWQKEGMNIAHPPLPPIHPPRAPIIRQSTRPTPSSPLVQSPHWSATSLRSDANVWSRVKSNIARNSRFVSYKDVGSLKATGKRPADRPDGLACPSKKSNVTGPKNSASGIDLNVDPEISNAEVSRDELDVLSFSRFLHKGESSGNVSDFDPIPDNIARSEPLKLTPGARHILRPSPNVYQNNPRPIHSTILINEIVNSGKASQFHI